MAKRYSRRRTVRGKPDYCWITTCGVAVLEEVAGGGTPYDFVLIPDDWRQNDNVENGTTLVHLVYTHAIFGANAAASFAYCSLYSLCKHNDTTPMTSPPNLGQQTQFANFFTEYDECLHWGQYTAMPFNSPANASSATWPAGGSLAGMPENMVNLNVRRKMKGDDAIKVIWGSGSPVSQSAFYCRWWARSLVRLGLK